MLYMIITQEQNICSVFHLEVGTQTFSTVSARIWNALIVKFNVNVPLTRFKVSLKLYLSSNILTISYPK